MYYSSSSCSTNCCGLYWYTRYTPAEDLFLKSLLGLHSSRACARDYLWQLRRDMNCNWLCPWELFFLFVCVCVHETERERETAFYLLPKVALIQLWAFLLHSCSETLCSTLCVFRVGSEKGSFQRTSCSRNFRKKPLFFSWEAGEAAAVMTELSFEDMEGMALPHHASPSAMLKDSVSRTLPDPARAARGVTACPLSAPLHPPPLPKSPSWYMGCCGVEGCVSHPACSQWGEGWSFHQALTESGRTWTTFPAAAS